MSVWHDATDEADFSSPDAQSRVTQVGALNDELRTADAGYGEIGQALGAAWRRKQQLEDRVPAEFAEAVSAAVAFADLDIAGTAAGLASDPASGAWSSATDRG